MNKMKKILIAIAIVLVLAFVLEAVSYLWQSTRLVKQGYRFANNSKIPPYPTKIISFSDFYFNKFDKDRILNNIQGKEYTTPSVLAFGDVYLNSFNEKNNTLGHIISRYTKRPVYNMGESGWGIPHMYFLLNGEKTLENFNPATIIFVYHEDLKNRLTSFSFYPHHNFLNLKYKLKDGNLVEDKPLSNFLYKSYAFRHFERYYGWRKISSQKPEIQQKNFDIIQSLFEESKGIAEKKYSNFKNFVILRFVPDYSTIDKLEKYKDDNKIAAIEYYMWKQLEKDGFIIIDVNLSEYADCSHNLLNKDSSPKSEFYEKIMPVLMEKSIQKCPTNRSNSVISTKQVKETKTSVQKKPVTNKTVIKKTEDVKKNTTTIDIRPELINKKIETKSNQSSGNSNNKKSKIKSLFSKNKD